MTIGDFFDMHYMHEIVFDEDYEQDMQLPFKVLDFILMPVFVLQNHKVFDIDKNDSTFITINKINTSYIFYLRDATLSGIFHPPKISWNIRLNKFNAKVMFG